MKSSFSGVRQTVESLVVSAAAIFYVLYWRPTSILGIVGVVVCVVVSSLPLWVKRYREKGRYAPLLQCAGFGLLLIASLQGGKNSWPFAIGFGILFLRSALRAYEDFSLWTRDKP